MWVRGLKLATISLLATHLLSHPMWVRGLKHSKACKAARLDGRTLCGCVD